MIDSILSGLLEKSYFNDLHTQILTEENLLAEWVKDAKETLELTLNDEQKKLLSRYANTIKNLQEDVCCQLRTHALNLGIMIGMELQDYYNKLNQ
ncbi:MAG: hypothetical protein HFE26_02725 [Clostridia bacterium]|nr:hypothetical protein [Clostridia bacterium]